MSADYFFNNNDIYRDFQSCGYLIPSNTKEMWLTDEAYSASSIATGYPVREGSISMDSSDNELTTFFDVAKESNKKIGLITNASLSYITPACFTVHSENWEDEYRFAEKQVGIDFDLLMGGGQKFFLKNRSIKNFPQVMLDNGYTYIDSLTKITTIKPDSTKVIGLFTSEEVDGSAPHGTNLQNMTSAALEYLQSKQGFVLLVNNTHLDWYSHQKQEKNLLLELNEIAETIRIIRNFQKKNPGSLLILTGGYDSGGFIISESIQYGRKGTLKQTSRKHTANFAPIFASGPQHAKFNRIITPAELGKIIKKIVR